VRRRSVLAGAILVLVSGCVAHPKLRPRAVAAPSTAPPAPGTRGHAPATPLRVTTREVTFSNGSRALPTTVWSPAPLGAYPIVVFGHGLTGVPIVYQALLSRWAAAGFVVAAPRFPHTSALSKSFDLLDVVNQPADMGAVLSGLLNLRPDDSLRQRLDPQHVAAAGHSAGAITTLGVFTDDGPERRDPRFAAGVVLAGNLLGMGDHFSNPAARLLFAHATGDPVVPIATGRAAYDSAPWPKAFLTLAGDQHTSPYVDAQDPQFPAVASATRDFLRGCLYGDENALARLARQPHVTESGNL
jgi:dienelactone hydrolase